MAAALEELAAAQARTDERLAAAQARTDQRFEELAAAQARTEQEIKNLAVSVTNQITALGSRWGIYNESTFRATIQGLFSKMANVTVKEGYYGGRQVDVVIRNGEHILLEITSRMHTKDIENLYQSADDYRKREGTEPTLMIATSYVSPKLMRKIMELPRPIEIFSAEAE